MNNRRGFLASVSLCALTGCVSRFRSGSGERAVINGGTDIHTRPFYGDNAARTNRFHSSMLPAQSAEVRESNTGINDESSGDGAVRLGIKSSPVISNGTAYFCTQKQLVAYDLNRDQQSWKINLRNAVSTSPALSGQTVFVTTIRGTKAINRDNGTVFWERDFGWGTAPGKSPIVKNKTLYEVGPELAAVDAETGEENWRTEGNHPNGVAVRDSVYLSGGDSSGGQVSKYALDGEQLWEATVPQQILAPPSVSDGRVYVVTDRKKLYCLDTTDGSVVWQNRVEQGISEPTAVSNNHVICSSGNGTILKTFDVETGDNLWELSVGSSTDAPHVVGDHVLFSDASGGIYLIDAESGERLQTWQTELRRARLSVGNGYVMCTSPYTNTFAVIQ